MMRKPTNIRRFGSWMGAAALLIQILIPFVIAFDMQAMSPGNEDHARHVAAVSHLRAAHADNTGNPFDGSTAEHGQHQHIGCPLCLALHAANAALPYALAALPEALPVRQRDPSDSAAIARAFPCPASYLSRAPPALA